MKDTLLPQFLTFLQTHPQAGGVMTFVIAFLESLALIGSIIPGSVTMTSIGILIGTRVLPVFSTVSWAVLGALLGDYLSYWIGLHYRDKIRNWKIFKRYPNWLNAAEDFFKRHGGKSILIGRFFGPMRSMIPVIAGILNMPRHRVILAFIPSACLWATLYLTPGILLGHLSLQLPPKLATEFLSIALLIVITLWALVWMIERSFQYMSELTELCFKRIWQWCHQTRSLSKLCAMLSPTERDNSHNQLARLIFILCMGGLLVSACHSVANQGLLTHFNGPIHYLFQSLHTAFGTKIATGITLLGNHHVIYLASLGLAIWMIYYQHYRTAKYWIILLIISQLSTLLIKNVMEYPRPQYFAFLSLNAFPSGHVSLFTAFSGFIAVLINRSLRDYRRRSVYYFVGCITLLIGLSRLYLEAHWLSDIIGGWLLGFLSILITLLLYRRQNTTPIPPLKLAKATLTILTASWIGVGYLYYQPIYNGYLPKWPIHFIRQSRWWEHPIQATPLYRRNRFGKPAQAFNIHWQGYLSHIQQSLMHHGWTVHPSGTSLRAIIYRFSHPNGTDHLPLIPLTYQNRSPVLLVTQLQPQTKRLLILRLWKSSTLFTDSQKPLWIGTLSYHFPPHHYLTKGHKAKFTELVKGIMNTTKLLIPSLSTQHQWKRYPVPIALIKQYGELPKAYDWDGVILLIR